MTVGPDYTPPPLSLPERWQLLPQDRSDLRREAEAMWWERFGDDTLSLLIRDTIQGNKDIKRAVARIDEARAQLAYALGGRFPEVEGGGAVVRATQSESVNPKASPQTTYRSSLSAAWELDLFGRIRRSVEAATADLEAVREDAAFVMLSACAETARTYFSLVAAEAQLDAVRRNAQSQREVLEIVQARVAAGLAAELDEAQAEEALATTEARIPPLVNTIGHLTHGLSLLTGRFPENITKTIVPASLPRVSDEMLVPVGIPADILRRRPDIRAAERRLAAETARVGVATADLYPSLSLSGVFGVEAIGAGDLVKQSSIFYSLGPSIRWSVFDAGRLRSRIKAADARVEQALRSYEQAVLQAVTEVENALLDYRELSVRVHALERSLAAAQRVQESAMSYYVSGLVSFQSVLDAARSLLEHEVQLAQARGELIVSIVNIAKAVGGKWAE